MKCTDASHLTIESLIGVLQEAIAGGTPKETLVYACGKPSSPKDCKIENAKPIFSACSCETNKHLVLLVEE